MPTGSKLVAALCLGILGAVVAELVKVVILREISMNFGYFTPVSAGLGLFVGWKFLGARAGGTVTDAINNGITSVVALLFLGLFVFGTTEMLDQALRNAYSEPMEALRGIIQIAIDYARYLLDVNVIAALVIGALLSGLLAELAHRHWR